MFTLSVTTLLPPQRRCNWMAEKTLFCARAMHKVQTYMYKGIMSEVHHPSSFVSRLANFHPSSSDYHPYHQATRLSANTSSTRAAVMLFWKSWICASRLLKGHLLPDICLRSLLAVFNRVTWPWTLCPFPCSRCTALLASRNGSTVSNISLQTSASFAFRALHILHPPTASILYLNSLAFVTFGPIVLANVGANVSSGGGDCGCEEAGSCKRCERW